MDWIVEMTDAKQGRKPSVPKIERVVEFIHAGEYDGNLGLLRDAIDTRNDTRKAAVLELVQEVYGKDAEITNSDSVEKNPFIKKAQQESSMREHQERLPGPYRADPVDGNSLRAAGPPDSEGYITVTDIFGGHETRVRQNRWQSWRVIETDDDDSITPDPLSDLDGVERQMGSEKPDTGGRGGAVISGLGSGDIAD